MTLTKDASRPTAGKLVPTSVLILHYVGDTRGRILITFMPAGQMEAFFREVTKANAMSAQAAELWRAHGMELMGPPLSLG